MQYADYINSLASYGPYLVGDMTTDAPFQDASLNAWLPRIIEYAELRLLRDPDLDFLAMRQYFPNGTMSIHSRMLPLPENVIVPERILYFTPLGTTQNAQILIPTSIDFIDLVCSGVPEGPPIYFAMAYDSSQPTAPQVILGPVPDATYAVSVYGTARPMALSAGNPSTFLSTFLPDMFLAASLISLSSYQKNFIAAGGGGASGPSPLTTTNWEAMYQEQRKGAAVEEARKRMTSAGWSPYGPTQLATPPRT